MPLSLERRSAKGDSRAAPAAPRAVARRAAGRHRPVPESLSDVRLRARSGFPASCNASASVTCSSGVFMLLTARIDGSRRLLFRVQAADRGRGRRARQSTGCCSTSCRCPGSARRVSTRSVAGLGDRSRRHRRRNISSRTGRWTARWCSIPEGILSTWPACFNVLLGALAGLAYHARNGARGPQHHVHRRRRRDDGAGDAARRPLSAHQEPLDQHLRAVQRRIRARVARRAHARHAAPVVRPALWPARIFGENPLLAYILVFLAAPLIDAQWLGTPEAPTTLRNAGQAWFSQFVEPRAASLLFALCGIGVHLRRAAGLAIASAGSSSSDAWN